MHFTIEYLKPALPVLNIDGIDVRLSILTLSKTVELNELYGDLNEIYTVIKNDPMVIIKLCWIMCIDKNIFDYKFKNFQDAYLTMPLKEVGSEAMGAWNDCVFKSLPQHDNKKRKDELAKIRNAEGAGQEVVPCYGKYYDTIAKRYSLTLDEFFELTLRQVSAHLQTIGDESYIELEVRAALAGRKMKPRIIETHLTEAEDKEMDEYADSVVAELEKKYQAGLKNKGK